jgi:hypothetical protein
LAPEVLALVVQMASALVAVACHLVWVAQAQAQVLGLVVLTWAAEEAVLVWALAVLTWALAVLTWALVAPVPPQAALQQLWQRNCAG